MGSPHDPRSLITMPVNAWALGGCSYVAVRAVILRHNPAAEPAESWELA
jgi:hypothetical protein